MPAEQPCDNGHGDRAPSARQTRAHDKPVPQWLHRLPALVENRLTIYRRNRRYLSPIAAIFSLGGCEMTEHERDAALLRIEQKVDRVQSQHGAKLQKLQESIDRVDDRLSDVLRELRYKGMLDDRPDDHEAQEATG